MYWPDQKWSAATKYCLKFNQLLPTDIISNKLITDKWESDKLK